jgi:hypothetical protein
MMEAIDTVRARQNRHFSISRGGVPRVCGG